MKKTNIRDIARIAGVSVTTVSKALNGYSDVNLETKRKIECIAEQMHYVPDNSGRALGGKPETTVAYLVSELMPTNESGFVFGLISSLYQLCSNSGYEFIILATNHAKQQKLSFLQLCRKRNLSGIVVSGLKTDDPYYDEIMNIDIPCALIDMTVQAENKCSVSIDNVDAALTAVAHLLLLGHTRIGLINGMPKAEVSQHRFEGYRKALHQAGLEVDSALVKSCNFDENEAYFQTIDLIQQNPDMTAIFCASDTMACGAARAISHLGRQVPGDISLVGFDDIPTAKYICGGLTTVRQDPYIIGMKAGEAIKLMIDNKPVCKDIIVPYEFVVRKSTIMRSAER